MRGNVIKMQGISVAKGRRVSAERACGASRAAAREGTGGPGPGASTSPVRWSPGALAGLTCLC